MAHIRAIFFDAVGTLLHPEPPFVEVYLELGGVWSRCPGCHRRALCQGLPRQEQIDADNGQRTARQ